MAAWDEDSDRNPKVLEPERLDKGADGDGNTAGSVQNGEAAVAGDAASSAMAPAAADDDALLGALTAMSLDHAFIDHALDQLTSSADLFDVPALHAAASSDFFSPDNAGES